MAGYVDGSGNAVLFATTSASTTANTLITVTDTGLTAAPTVLATAPTGDAFRGVEYLVPEPSVFALTGLGLVGLVFVRRFRR